MQHVYIRFILYALRVELNCEVRLACEAFCGFLASVLSPSLITFLDNDKGDHECQAKSQYGESNTKSRLPS